MRYWQKCQSFREGEMIAEARTLGMTRGRCDSAIGFLVARAGLREDLRDIASRAECWIYFPAALTTPRGSMFEPGQNLRPVTVPESTLFFRRLSLRGSFFTACRICDIIVYYTHVDQA